jgi:ABC-type dipeptide/oligopeptide/nickel transport system permease subunit
MARWGLLIVVSYGLVALLTPLLIHAGLLPDANAGLENPIYAAPSWGHWCGTDRLGRDVCVCVRTLAGSGVALQVVLIALIAALVVGVPLGMVSGYLGGWLDRTLVLLMDTLYTLPVLLTLHAADAVLVLGGLGFLGLGLPETIPEWGSELQQALTAVSTGIWWTTSCSHHTGASTLK